MEWETKESKDLPYQLLNAARSLFNEPRLSDVRFLVDGQTVFGHKLILAMGSPVFEHMLSAIPSDSKEHSLIEIKDLSSIGFKNALRYIYGYPIDYKLTQLYESYMAADRYMLHGFSKAFFAYITTRLNAESSCLIYDQLVKIGEREEISLDHVRTMIIENSKAIFESEHFTQIDQKTLISILSLDELNIDEADLLAAVSKWIDCELQRLELPVNGENRRRAFEPIKGYILFSELSPEHVANCKEIAELLSVEEIGPVLLHLLNKANKLKLLELKTTRKAGTSACKVFICDSSRMVNLNYSREVYLSVNVGVGITAIYTTFSPNATNLNLKIWDPTYGLVVKLETEESSLKDGKLCFLFNRPFEIRANALFTLSFTVDPKATKCCEPELFSKQSQLVFSNVIFNLFAQPPHTYHCIRGLKFVPL